MRSTVPVVLVAAVVLAAAAAPPAAAQQAQEPAWLQEINTIRVANGLAPAVEDTSLDAAIALHLRYLRLTPAEFRTGAYANAHSENPASPYYTEAGARAGGSSNLGGGRDELDSLHGWLTAPFHAIGSLRPGLRRVALHHDSETGQAGQDVFSGYQHTPVTAPVLFPGPRTTTSLTRFRGESPNPLTPCGYQAAGLPLIALLPDDPTADLRAELTHPDGSSTAGPSDALCVVTKHNWRSPDTVYGPTGAAILDGDNAVFVIPPKALQRGTYAVRLTQTGRPDVSWSFQVEPPPMRATPSLQRSDCGIASPPGGRSWLPLQLSVEDDPGADQPSTTRTITLDLAGRRLSLTHESGGHRYTLGGTLRDLDEPSRRLPVGEVAGVLRVLDHRGAELVRTPAVLPACAPPAAVWQFDREVVSAPSGQLADVTAVLRQQQGEALPGQPVALEQQQADGTWQQVQAVETDDQGRAHASAPAGARVRFLSVTTPAAQAAESPVLTVERGPAAVPLGMALDRTRVVHGQSLTVSVTGTPGAVVDVLARVHPSTTFSRVRTGLVLDADGRVTTRLQPVRNTVIEVVERGNAQPGLRLALQVAQRLTLEAVPRSAREVLLRGSVSPTVAGQRVDLLRNGRLLRRGVPVDAAGRWSTTVAATGAGADVTVRAAASAAHAASTTTRRLRL